MLLKTTPVLRFYIWIILFFLPSWGEAATVPFSDPTIPFSESSCNISLKIDIFAEAKNLPYISTCRWRVGLIKIYPENSNNSWAMIQGRRIGVGYSFLGGQVVSLSDKRLELQQGQLRRSLRLFGCNSSGSVEDGRPCRGMFFAVEKP